MGQPPFTMSKYATELDLQRDKAQFYLEQNVKLTKCLMILRREIDAKGLHPAGCIIDAEDVGQWERMIDEALGCE